MANSIRILFMFLFMFNAQNIFAQINEEPSIEQALERYYSYHKNNPRTEIYAITVLITRDRRELDRERERFRTRFPDSKMNWSYKQPYYVIETGKFITEREAWNAFNAVREVYPNAIINNKRIRPSEYFKG